MEYEATDSGSGSLLLQLASTKAFIMEYEGPILRPRGRAGHLASTKAFIMEYEMTVQELAELLDAPLHQPKLSSWSTRYRSVGNCCRE